MIDELEELIADMIAAAQCLAINGGLTPHELDAEHLLEQGAQKLREMAISALCDEYEILGYKLDYVSGDEYIETLDRMKEIKPFVFDKD